MLGFSVLKPLSGSNLSTDQSYVSGRDRMAFINNLLTGVTCAEMHGALERQPDGKKEKKREKERETKRESCAELVSHFSDITINHGDSSKPSLRACRLMKLLRRCDQP